MNHLGSDDFGKLVSRRSLLLSAGGGLAVSLLGSSGLANALESAITPSSSVDPRALKVVQDYLAARSDVTTGGDFRRVSQFINPDQSNLIDFESARFGELSSLGSPKRWNGVIDGVASTPEILSGVQTGKSVRILVKDWTSIDWRSAPALKPIQRTPEEEAIVRQDPVRYGLNVPDWAPIRSGFGTEHLITLEFSNGRWLVVHDAYAENTLMGVSPDFSSSIGTSIKGGSTSAFGPASLKATGMPSPLFQPKAASLTAYTFDYMAAVYYARTWANSYNPAYANWAASQADCANYVSQSFKAGGYPNDGSWSPYTYAWVNNIGLRNWLISSGRGHDSSLGAIGYADAINYDWTNNGVLDHIVIVTNWSSGGVPLVCSHTGAAYEVPYDSYYRSAYPNMTLKFTSTYLYYSA